MVFLWRDVLDREDDQSQGHHYESTGVHPGDGEVIFVIFTGLLLILGLPWFAAHVVYLFTAWRQQQDVFYADLVVYPIQRPYLAKV
jgi:hypothetical protein